jgi:hypothetical protein
LRSVASLEFAGLAREAGEPGKPTDKKTKIIVIQSSALRRRLKKNHDGGGYGGAVLHFFFVLANATLANFTKNSQGVYLRTKKKCALPLNALNLRKARTG